MNKLQVTYTSALACTPQSTTPTQPFICGTGQGAATWPGGGQAIGYTLTPSSEVSDVPMGAACTDTLFPNGG